MPRGGRQLWSLAICCSTEGKVLAPDTRAHRSDKQQWKVKCHQTFWSASGRRRGIWFPVPGRMKIRWRKWTDRCHSVVPIPKGGFQQKQFKPCNLLPLACHRVMPILVRSYSSNFKYPVANVYESYELMLPLCGSPILCPSLPSGIGGGCLKKIPVGWAVLLPPRGAKWANFREMTR